MIKRVYRAQRELDIALRIDVVRHPQRHIADILDIAVLIDDDDAFGEHRLTHRPDAVHHLARLPRVALADRHDHEVVKYALDRQVDIDDLRQSEAHQRQKDALDRLA